MSDLHLANGAIRKGCWHGRLEGGDGQPSLEVTWRDSPVPDLSVTAEEGGWAVRVPIPEDAVSDGVQTFVLTDTSSGARLGDFTLIAGEAVGEDIRAEMQLLRAELDMLKRAFRRHCVETA